MRLPWRRQRDAESRLASVDAGARRSFVAALWAARGWETRVEGERVVATNHPQWADTTLLVPADGAVPADLDGVDAVVTTRPDDAPVRVLTPPDVVRSAKYGTDRAVAERLARRHLDAPLVAETPSRSRVIRPDAALVALVAVVVLSAVVGAAGAPGSSPASPTEAADQSTTTPGQSPARPSEDDRIAVGNLLAPGLSNEGVVDAETLAAAHTRAVTDRSYVWFVSYREYRNSSRSLWPATRTERVVVENATSYRSEAGGWGSLAGTPYVVADVDAYADGQYRYVRDTRNETTTYERIPVYGRTLSGGERGTALAYAERAGRYVRWFLSAEATRVHDVVTIDNRTYYRVTAFGSDYPEAENFSAVALVAPNGFVTEMRITYDVVDSNRVAEIQLSYWDRNESVERPRWYDDARNATRPVLGGAGEAGRASESVTPPMRYRDSQPPRPPHGNTTPDEPRAASAVSVDDRLRRKGTSATA
jgi:hypothetical protein